MMFRMFETTTRSSSGPTTGRMVGVEETAAFAEPAPDALGAARLVDFAHARRHRT